MEHTNEQNLYTERYLLNEMPSEERAAFEEHFFTCQTCGEDVRAAARMFASGHQVALEEERAKVRPIRRAWWVPQAAAASIVTAFLTWFLVPARMPAVLITSTSNPPQTDMQIGQTRSAEDAKPVRITVPNELVFELYDPKAAGFEVSIRKADGKTLHRKSVSLEESQNPVKVLLHALPRGRYELVIEGVQQDGNRFSIPGKTFEVIGER